MGVNCKINLDKPKSTTETYLFHSISYHGFRFRIKSRVKVKPSFFDKRKNKQCIKPTHESCETLNALLNQEKLQITDNCNRLLFLGKQITKENLLPLLPFTKATGIKTFDFFSTYSEWIEVNAKKQSKATITVYGTTLKHILSFKELRNYSIEFDTINSTFFEKFTNYLIEAGNHNNNIGKNVKTLKTFMYWAFEKGYHTNKAFEKFEVWEEKNKDIICLEVSELKQIINYEPPNDRLKDVKELFLLECFTGLRFSDIQNLKKENIYPDYLILTTIKMREKLTVPVNQLIREILPRHVQRGKKPISNQKMNKYLKELSQLAGLTRRFEYVKYSGAKRVTESFELWQKISTHAGRHTFISISLMLGFDIETVKAITGHKKYETLKKYIHINNKHKSEKMRLWENL